jgi:hypothetical protein
LVDMAGVQHVSNLTALMVSICSGLMLYLCMRSCRGVGCVWLGVSLHFWLACKVGEMMVVLLVALWLGVGVCWLAYGMVEDLPWLRLYL